MQEDVFEGFRLSPQQEHLWSLLRDDGGKAYRSICAFDIEGPLDINVLMSALRLVVTRHEILRTTFKCLPEMTIPVQTIGESSDIAMREIDGASFGEFARQQLLADFFGELRAKPFDYERGPLMDLSLVVLSETRRLLLVSISSLCADAIALETLQDELARCYRASLCGESVEGEPMQYADLSEWQNEILESPDAEIGIRYWRNKDYSTLSTLKLSFENGSPRADLTLSRSFDVQTYRLAIGVRLASKIAETSAEQSISASACLLACWAILLSRLTGQPALIITSTCDGRKYDGLKGAMGLLAKSLPIHNSIDEDESFVRFVKEVADTANEASRWQEYFSWQLAVESDPALSEQAPEPFGFAFAKWPAPSQVDHVRFSTAARYACIDRFKIKLDCAEYESGIAAEFLYNAEYFFSEDIERLAGQYLTLLESAMRDPNASVSHLEVVPDVERRQLLFEFNDTSRTYGACMCIHQLFEDQVARTSDAIAVVFEGEHLTYRELNERANGQAHYLTRIGVSEGALVGLSLERSIQLVVSLIAILKAGAAYLPLDSQYPKERLAFMARDANIEVLVKSDGAASDLDQEVKSVVLVDRDRELFAAESGQNPSGRAAPDDLAYMIYTSGSTGTPKGVMISHRAICNRLLWMCSTFSIGKSDKVLQKTPFSFDASVWEFFVPLLAGAQLILAKPGGHRDSAYLAEIIEREDITILQLVPSMLQVFLDEPEVSDYVSLARVFCGGENFPIKLQERFFERSRAKLFNLYGPTEASIDATYWKCKADHRRFVPIGHPLANVQVYILDRNCRPVPIGAPGELYIGGTGLARGYFNRPQLTAERFIPDPFGSQSGGRLYQTGDLVRSGADGTIEFLGRMDHQVKLRGFRIELGEIEATLSEHHAVRQAIVVVCEDTPDAKNLVAYVVANREPADESQEPTATGERLASMRSRSATSNDLRAYLKARLPEYMVPSSFIFVKSFPVLPNGKVDKRALPPPGQSELEIDRFYAQPRTLIEEELVRIWRELLPVARVDIYDNFFELGGHSLLATQLISRVREAFGVELSFRSIFESPIISSMAEAIKAIKRSELGKALEVPPIVPVSREGRLPLSFSQQRLWFLDQFEPGSAVYNIAAAISLKGWLDVEALEKSINEVIDRHESLRTTFDAIDGEPVQIIAPEMAIGLQVTDLQRFPLQEREGRARQAVIAEASHTFDLKRGPLFRASLLKLAEEEHVVLLVMHHIISDGWSTSILVRELSTFYHAISNGDPARLPKLPVQYADYAVWQKDWLQGEALDQLVGYWKMELAGAPDLLVLPTDRARPPQQTHNGAADPLYLRRETSEGLKALGTRQGGTLFMTLLAAFNALLYRYCGQSDICIGTPVAGRTRMEIENLIGLFINTLVLRTDLTGGPTFRELVGRVREKVLSASVHQDLPFEKLVAELQLQRALSHSPLFQALFQFQNAQPEPVRVQGLSIEPFEVDTGSAKFELTLSMFESDHGLGGFLEYNTDLFDRSTAKRMLDHFQILLDHIAEDPDQQISDLALLTESDRRQILYEWNDTAAQHSHESVVHLLFDSQAGRTPAGIALVFNEESLTYGELNAQANRLARYLRSLGVGPETKVGVLLERSIDMVVGLLGILKAGGAYVPVDSSYPKDRISFILGDAQCSALLTQRSLADSLSNRNAVVVCLDTHSDFISQKSPDPVQVDICPDNLAYVIYTSGSTGKQKGVEITHRAVVNFLHSMTQAPGITQSDALLAVTSLSFDIAALELFLPLVTGAKVVLATSEDAADGSRLIEKLSRNKITIMQATPATWSMLLRAGWEDGSELKILCGGEALPQGLAAQLLRHCDCVWNMYGPTETTIWSAIHRVDSAARSIPLGRPISDTKIFLLDARLNFLPVGVPGELYIGGTGLARGYFNRPQLTAERFIPDPFGSQSGGRLYQTGDLVRSGADGTIEFLGRMDHQVKLRGFRIELGEIEAALVKHQSIDGAVVSAREDAGGEKRLIAYVVGKAGANIAADSLRNFLSESLPTYMLPSTFVVLAEFPYTPNGKIDRRALPAPDFDKREGRPSGQASATQVEEVIANIWAEVLGLDRVGTDENFFDLGGHSLLATQVISRLREILGVEIAIRRLFETPTVSGLAETIEEAIRAARGFQLPPIVAVSRQERMQLSFAQQRLWFLEQFSPGTATFNIPAAVRLNGDLSIEALQRSLGEIVRRHEALRTGFDTERGQPVQVIGPPRPLNVPITDLTGLPESLREALAYELFMQEAQHPFDIKKPPLLRVALLRLDAREHVVAFTMHHIVSDGWSVGVLVGEVASLYAAYLNGEPSPLPELTIQYTDYAVWQRRWMHGEVVESQLAYWKQQLSGLPEALNLPTDRPRPPVRTFNGAMHRVRLSQPLSAELNRLSRKEGVTLFMTLLASYQSLLCYYTRREEIAVGTDIANRNRIEMERLIGFFVNQLVLRGDLSGDPEFGELLRRSREVTLGAYAHQDIPFEQLVDALKPSRNLTHSPLFQVKLVFQNAPVKASELSNLSLSLLESDIISAKFDLTLLLGEETDGIAGYFEYNRDLFDTATITRMSRLLVILLEQVVKQPQVRLSELYRLLAETDRREHAMYNTRREEAKLNKLKSIKPKALSAQQTDLIKEEMLIEGIRLPLMLKPAVRDIDLVGWASHNQSFIGNKLVDHGAILFRGFDVLTPEYLEQFASTICADLFNENGEHPRDSVIGNIYTPVFYPPDQQLLWHNENSFNLRWPTKVWFCCVTPPEQGGETPIVDGRKVFESIDPAVRRRFIEKGVMYVRNYSKGLGLDWQDVFRTSDMNEVERLCRINKMEFEWRAGAQLKTRCIRPAVVKHPKTGENSWFNQAQHWHVSCLDAQTGQSVFALLKEEDFPRNCYYGDGSRIADEDMKSILDVYARLEVAFRWERGDVLLIDNILTAHGRNPYKGARKLLVSMGDMNSYDSLQASANA
jgi:amino acid adenylation domain-containing protein